MDSFIQRILAAPASLDPPQPPMNIEIPVRLFVVRQVGPKGENLRPYMETVDVSLLKTPNKFFEMASRMVYGNTVLRRMAPRPRVYYQNENGDRVLLEDHDWSRLREKIETYDVFPGLNFNRRKKTEMYNFPC